MLTRKDILFIFLNSFMKFGRVIDATDNLFSFATNVSFTLGEWILKLLVWLTVTSFLIHEYGENLDISSPALWAIVALCLFFLGSICKAGRWFGETIANWLRPTEREFYRLNAEHVSPRAVTGITMLSYAVIVLFIIVTFGGLSYIFSLAVKDYVSPVIMGVATDILGDAIETIP